MIVVSRFHEIVSQSVTTFLNDIDIGTDDIVANDIEMEFESGPSATEEMDMEFDSILAGKSMELGGNWKSYPIRNQSRSGLKHDLYPISLLLVGNLSMSFMPSRGGMPLAASWRIIG